MKQTTKSYLFIAAAFVAATIIISVFLPRKEAVSLNFTEGEPWRHEQLTSAFSFAVYKSEKALQEERAAVVSAQRPYYTLDINQGSEAQSAFEAAYKQELYLLVSSKLSRQVSKRLAELYSHGIISSNDLSRLQADSISNIMLIKQNVATPRPVDELFTVQQAYEYIMSTDTTLWGRHALQNCNLNDYIQPNLHYDAAKSEAALSEALEAISLTSKVIQTSVSTNAAYR